MTLFSKLLAFVFVFMLMASFLYVIFGQVTVRRLRKNPKTKEVLGLEFVSGWDIINAAQALSLPQSWSEKLLASRALYLYANTKKLRENTTKLDRILGASFSWTMMLSGLSGAALVFFNALGLIPG